MSTTQPTPHKKTRHTRKAGFAAVLAVAALGVGAFASFTDTETASRSVDAGQLDIQVGPEVLSVSNMAPGDRMARGIAIDIDSEFNDGNLIAAITLDLEGSVADICADVNAGQSPGTGGEPYVCEDDFAHLMDGNALDMAILACPDGGQIFDANPDVDDDGNPGTDSRMDGPGPYTCVVDGDVVPFLVARDYEAINRPYDPQVEPEMVTTEAWLTPHNTGAASVDIERPFVDEWTDQDGETHRDIYPDETFADGQTLELITCIEMPSDIRDRGALTDKEDNDYENLSADLNFNWSALQRPGQAQAVGTGPGEAAGERIYAENCDQNTWWWGDPGDSGDPGDPDIYFEGDNTIHGIFWTEGHLPTGQYDPDNISYWGGVPVFLYADHGDSETLIASLVGDEDDDDDPFWDATEYWFENLIDGDYIVRAGYEGTGTFVELTTPNVAPDATNSDFVPLPGNPAFGEVRVSVSGGESKQFDLGISVRGTVG